MDMDASGKLDVSIRLYHGAAEGTAGTPGFHGCGGESSPELSMSHGDSWWFNEIFHVIFRFLWDFNGMFRFLWDF